MVTTTNTDVTQLENDIDDYDERPQRVTRNNGELRRTKSNYEVKSRRQETATHGVEGVRRGMTML